MPAAARVGDPTSHGSPLGPGPGSLDVLIGKKSAWRAIGAGMGDKHACPLSNGPQPHGMGMVLKGSTSVFINKLPAARQGDEVMEVGGGPNKIAVGFPTVLIGG